MSVQKVFCKFTNNLPHGKLFYGLFLNDGLNPHPTDNQTINVMKELNLPEADLKLRNISTGNIQVFDPLRLKFVALTPEEWVRQHFVSFLFTHKDYPKGLMANEVAITLNSTSRRCDTVVYDRNASPVMIVEYKAPSVSITQRTFDQIVRYNMVLKVRYLTVTNGLNHYCCRVTYDPPSYAFLKDIPSYDDIINGV